MATELPVVVEVQRTDGTAEFVRVGTARRDGGVFVLDLGALRITPHAPPPASVSAPVPAERPSAPTPAPMAVPIGGTTEDLEYIAARARRTLADPSKSRWHSQEREILSQVERELERHRKS